MISLKNTSSFQQHKKGRNIRHSQPSWLRFWSLPLSSGLVLLCAVFQIQISTCQNGEQGHISWLKQGVNTTHCYCGLIDHRIASDDPTVIISFPWLAGVILKRASRQFCGGTLINSRYILTAANCVQGLTPDNIEILFNVTTSIGAQGGQETKFRRSVDNILIHENFTSRLDFDAALIRLSEPVDMSGQTGNIIKPVCLPSEEDLEKLYIGENATMVGWEYTSEYGDRSKKVNVDIISNKECSRHYQTLTDRMHYQTITDRMLCANNVGKNRCQSDSGGPLHVMEGEYDPSYTEGKTNRYFVYVQVGIISWGQGCGANPGVYSRVTELIKWISANAKDGSYCSNFRGMDATNKDAY